VGDAEPTAGGIVRPDGVLLEHPLDADFLMRHSDVAFRLGMRDAALEDLGKILLFEPGRQDALRRKAAIECAGLPGK
jgi:hypothetical protein